MPAVTPLINPFVETFSFKRAAKADGSVLAPFPSSLGDWAVSIKGLSVKDFGAVGDGIHDDTDNIQACLNVCFGTYNSPHWNTVANIPCYFPAGKYIVKHTLVTNSLLNGLIHGAGSGSTWLIYQGNVPGDVLPWFSDPNYAGMKCTCLFATNGMRGCTIQGLTFQMPGISTSTTPNSMLDTCCFLFDYEPDSAPGGAAYNFWRDLVFRDATFGAILMPNSHGSGGDGQAFFNCGTTNCWRGLVAAGQNTLSCGVIGGIFEGATGGTFANEASPIYGSGGSFCQIDGVLFRNNEFDRGELSGAPQYLGIYSSSTSFLVSKYGGILTGLYHAGTGVFIRCGVDGSFILDGCYSGGTIVGSSGTNATYYLRGGTRFGAGSVNGFPAVGGPGIREWVTTDPLTFSMLPTTAVVEGCEVNITDGPVSPTWGQIITSGTASGTKVKLRWNGTNWRVVGK